LRQTNDIADVAQAEMTISTGVGINTLWRSVTGVVACQHTVAFKPSQQLCIVTGQDKKAASFSLLVKAKAISTRSQRRDGTANCDESIKAVYSPHYQQV
jgi:hypothetical protein